MSQFTLFQPLAAAIGLRYTRAKRKNHFVSFIALTSMLGIALGVAVLITVLSVMNGFDVEIHHRFFGMAPEITVNGYDGRLVQWQKMADDLMALPGVTGVAPFVGGQGMLAYKGQVLPVILTGIDPARERSVTHLQDKLLMGNMEGINHFGAIIGRGIAEKMDLLPGDTMSIMIPAASVTPAGMIPRFKRFTVGGVFSAGAGFNFDARLIFIDLQDAQKLYQLGDAITGLKLKIKNVYDAPALSEKIAEKWGNTVEVGNWTQQFGEFFEAIKLEKRMMFLILMLIIAVAAFNLIASLVMIVSDKRKEIAILRTMGATPRFVLWVFIIQGIMVGVLGTFIGILGGLVLATYATVIVNGIQSFFHIKILSSSIYFVDELPSKIMLRDVCQVAGLALLMSFLATIYPALRASKTVIVEALHDA